MNGSYNFLLHLLGFGVVCGVLMAGLILDRRFPRETDMRMKLYLGGIMRSVGLISPFAILTLRLLIILYLSVSGDGKHPGIF